MVSRIWCAVSGTTGLDTAKRKRGTPSTETDICCVLLLTEILTSAKADCVIVASEKKRALDNVKTLSFASGDIASSCFLRQTKPATRHSAIASGHDVSR